MKYLRLFVHQLPVFRNGKLVSNGHLPDFHPFVDRVKVVLTSGKSCISIPCTAMDTFNDEDD